MAGASAEKTAFFDQLSALNESSDDADDLVATNNSSLSRASSSLSESFPQSKIHTPQAFVVSSTLNRSFSAPTPTSGSTSVIQETPVLDRHKPTSQVHTTTPLASEVSVVKETPNTHKPEVTAKAIPQRTNSAPAPSAALNTPFQVLSTMALGKRKRQDSTIQLKPETQQYFKGLSFMYIPNDDKDPRRRLRIAKAREHGASWIRTWNTSVTHIIVDKTLTYNDTIKYLKIPSIPANVTMVDEIYPIDCIQFTCILDPKQKQYTVSGHQQAADEEVKATTPPTTSEISGKSRQLKPVQSKVGKWDHEPRRSPPTRREESTPDALELVPPPPKESDIQHRDVATSHTLHEEHIVDETEGTYSHVSNGDVLDEMIKQARETAHLPLDDDDEMQLSHDESDSEDSEKKSESRSLRSFGSHKKTSKKGSFNQEHFSCMVGGTGFGGSSNSNQQTISILQEMANYYTRTRDIWRSIAYRKAITTLRSQTTRIVSSEQAKQLNHIGDRLAAKIEEIVLTNRLRRLENAKSEPSDITFGKFCEIYGVGSSQASKWAAQGHKTLEDLLEKVELTDNQRLGIAHYDDFRSHIPRDEVTALGKIVEQAAAAIDTEVDAIIGGSYRRGACSSGDIDFIFTKRGTSSNAELLPFLNELVTSLTKSSFLVAALAVPRSDTGSKWHGCCVLPSSSGAPIWRRIDFLLVPASELGAALIYFTGNDIFNRSIRLLASRKGMRLNQHGLYKDVMRGPGRVKVNEGQLLEGADEKRIFEILVVPWREPERRIC